MDGELESFIKVCLSIMASLLYSHFIASKLPKGKLRLLSLLPVFSLLAVLPLCLSSILLSGTVAFFITWLTTIKLLLFSFDSGPLASDPPLPFSLFASIACLPIRIKRKKAHSDHQKRREDSEGRPPRLALNLPTKILLFAILIAGDDCIDRLRPNAKLCVYCVALYFFVDILLGLSNAFFRSTFGVEVERPSNEPYLATSLQDFWGRRWNQLVSSTLRYSVYKPVHSAVEGLVGRRWAPVPAVLAVFVVSGLMHEQMVYYITRAKPTWEVTWFFVLQGVCMQVEFGLKTAVGKRWRPHGAVAGLVTMAFLVATAAWLFFPPLLRGDTFGGLFKEFKMGVGFVQAQLTSILG